MTIITDHTVVVLKMIHIMIIIIIITIAIMMTIVDTAITAPTGY